MNFDYKTQNELKLNFIEGLPEEYGYHLFVFQDGI